MNSWWAIEIGDAIDAAVSIAVLALYGGAFLNGVKARKMTAVDWLIAGIVMTWSGTLVDRMWRLAWRIFHHSHWMENSPVLLISLTMVACGGVMHISAKHENGGNAIVKSWRWLGAAVVGGVLLGALGIWLTLMESLDQS